MFKTKEDELGWVGRDDEASSQRGWRAFVEMEKEQSFKVEVLDSEWCNWK